MLAVTGEDIVFPDFYLDVKVTRRTTARSRFTLAREPNPVTGVDTSRYFHRQRLLLLGTTLAVTALTGVRYHFALTTTARAGLLN